MSSPNFDSRYTKPADVDAKIAAQAVTDTGQYVQQWKANTAYSINQIVIAPDGSTVSAKSNLTSTSTYQGINWTTLSPTTSYIQNNLGSNTVGNRLRRAALQAQGRNSIELGVMASPPTISDANSNTKSDTTLTNFYGVSTGQKTSFRITGAIDPGTIYAGRYLVPYCATMPSGSTGNTAGDSTHATYYWSVEFVTDAPKFSLRSLTVGAFQLEVNDQPISASPLTTLTGGGTRYTTYDFGSSLLRKIRIEYAYASGFDGIYIDPKYTLWPPVSETNLRVAMVGDSLITGTGDSTPSNFWGKVAGKLLGWTDVRQVAFGGTGFMNPGTYNTFGATQRINDVVSHNPDLLIIVATQNDDSYTASEVTSAALTTFQAYRSALPSVPIIVHGIDASSSGPSSLRLTQDAAVQSAFSQWSDSNSWFVPNVSDPTGSWFFGTGTTGSTTGSGNRDRFGYDSAHPNTAGHIYLGQRFANILKSYVIPKIP